PPPQRHTLGAEAHLHRLPVQRRQLAAPLDAHALQQRGQSRVGVEDGERQRGQELAASSLFHHHHPTHPGPGRGQLVHLHPTVQRGVTPVAVSMPVSFSVSSPLPFTCTLPRRVAGGGFGCGGRQRDARARPVTAPPPVQPIQQRGREPGGGQPPPIRPHHAAPLLHHHPRRQLEQRGAQRLRPRPFTGSRQGHLPTPGRGILTRSAPPRLRVDPQGRDPETDVGHVVPPAAPVPPARSTPSPSPAPAPPPLPLPPAR